MTSSQPERQTSPASPLHYDDPYAPKTPITQVKQEDTPFDRQSVANSGLTRGATVTRKPSDAAPHSTIQQNERYTYYDENFNRYSTGQLKEGEEGPNAPLKQNAAPPGSTYQGLEYQDPAYDPTNMNARTDKRSAWAAFLAKGRYPVEQRIEDKKRGIGRQRNPYVVWIFSVGMLGVLVWELVLNAREQGSPFSFKPVVNYMLGPSSSALINTGARFPPCMKLVPEVPVTLQMPCMNNTENPPDRVCPISELCGFGGIEAGAEPDQWFRFITAIFLHAGIVHFLLNMIAQLTLSAQIERDMGSGGFLLTYMAAGIFGNVLGGNFSLVGIPSVGASGAIFGTLAVTWVDLFAHWKYHFRPVRRLVFQTIELIIGFAIGYIPYLDNFAHIGGFVMGLFVSMIFYPVISETKRHRFVMWCFRVIGLVAAIILFVILTRNFYTSDPYSACQNCRYLSCWPTDANNRCRGTGLTTTEVVTSN